MIIISWPRFLPSWAERCQNGKSMHISCEREPKTLLRISSSGPNAMNSVPGPGERVPPWFHSQSSKIGGRGGLQHRVNNYARGHAKKEKKICSMFV